MVSWRYQHPRVAPVSKAALYAISFEWKSSWDCCWPQECCYSCTHTHARTHAPVFNGPFSGTTRVSWYQKAKTNLDFTEARDSEWQWHQLGHMHVCILLQTDNHASTPPLKFFTGRMPFLPPNQLCQSTEGTYTTLKILDWLIDRLILCSMWLYWCVQHCFCCVILRSSTTFPRNTERTLSTATDSLRTSSRFSSRWSRTDFLYAQQSALFVRQGEHCVKLYNCISNSHSLGWTQRVIVILSM